MSAVPDEPDLPPGKMLGRYRIERFLGAGAMGAVYLASHTGLGKRVVVKVLHAHYARIAEVRLRFVREGEAAARIRHAHVVDVTDVGVEGAIPYLVMEYLEGESLGDHIDNQGALSPDRAVDLMLPIIDAVHAAHRAGVVHRDLKPDNLFVVRTATGDLHPKVLDFGISRVVDESGRPDRTGTAAMLGTPAYMSPEQIESARDVDAASDQYALGVILYECLTGVQAFSGDGVFGVLLRVREGTFQRPRALRPEIDPQLEAAVLRAMAQDRMRRFPSLRALGTVLLPFASPRARMIWGTTFDPPTDHGPSDTRLEYASAPPRIGEADTIFHSAQEREHTTIPLAARRRRRRAWTVAAFGVVGALGLSAVALATLQGTTAPSPQAVLAPAARPTSAAALPVTSVVPLRVVPGTTSPSSVAVVPAATVDAGAVAAPLPPQPSPNVASTTTDGASGTRATHGRRHRNPRLPYLPP